MSFAMVPEIVAFAFATRVNPLVGLYAAFLVGLLTALFGGRPGMISDGAGSLAVVSVSLVVRYGPEYLFATVFLMGLVEVLVGALKWGKFISLVPHPVMLGFVNGLAIVILLAQLRHLQTPGRDGTLHWLLNTPFWIMLALVVLTVAITLLLPRLSKSLPSALVAIGVVSGFTVLFHIPTKHVGDLASIHGAFPRFHVPNVPFTLPTLQICLPYAVMLDMRYSCLHDHSALEAVAQLADRYGKSAQTLYLRHLDPVSRVLLVNADTLLAHARLSEE